VDARLSIQIQQLLDADACKEEEGYKPHAGKSAYGGGGRGKQVFLRTSFMDDPLWKKLM